MCAAILRKHILAVPLVIIALVCSACSVREQAPHVIAPAQMEYLDRGLVALETPDGVYLSWRLLGTEPFDTRFDVYCNEELVATVDSLTNYLDAEGGVSGRSNRGRPFRRASRHAASGAAFHSARTS